MGRNFLAQVWDGYRFLLFDILKDGSQFLVSGIKDRYIHFRTPV